MSCGANYHSTSDWSIEDFKDQRGWTAINDNYITLKSQIDTKRAPWDYSPNEVDAITQSSRCYAPKEAEIEKKWVTKEDAKQLISVMKMSEFEVIEQLRKMLAQISLLDLFKTSERHKMVLMKLLNEVHMPETINEV